MMSSPPKKSRKTFPKWTPGNAPRKYPSDKTYPAKPLLRVAEASLPHDAGSSSILKDRHVLGSVAGSPRSLAAPPHPASAFTPPSTFITMAMPGPGTSQSEEDMAGPAARGNLGFWLCCLVLSDRVGWGCRAARKPLLCSGALWGLSQGYRGKRWYFLILSTWDVSSRRAACMQCMVSALSGTSSVSWSSSSLPTSQKTI